MNLNENEQAINLINESKNVLIFVNPSINLDSITSGIALSLYLEKLEKKVTIYLENKKIDEKYNFLSSLNSITDKLDLKNKLTVSIVTKNVKAKELSYEPKEDRIEIYLTPEDGKSFTKDDVLINDSGKNFDLIITLGISNIKNIGEIYEKNTEFFFNKPIINIDIQNSNELYGKINYIEQTYCSLSELVFDFMTFYKSELIDENIATNILTGIIYNTKEFRSEELTATTMSAIATLMELGADKNKIMNNLYKTKPVDNIKAWAKMLENSKLDEDKKIFYSKIEDNKLSLDLSELFYGFINTIEKVEIAILFNKTNGITYIDLVCSENLNALEISSSFNPVGDKNYVKFAISSDDVEKVVEIVLRKIKEKM